MVWRCCVNWKDRWPNRIYNRTAPPKSRTGWPRKSKEEATLYEAGKIGMWGHNVVNRCIDYFYPTFLPKRKKGKLIRSNFCLCICPPISTFEPISIFLCNSVGRSCYWRWHGHHNFSSHSFNHSKMRHSKLLRSIKNSTSQPRNFVCWQIFTGWTTFNGTTFEKNQKYKRHAWLNLKIHILFYGENSWTVALPQMKFVAMKDHGHTYKYDLNYYTETSTHYSTKHCFPGNSLWPAKLGHP
jgi:hypothetical protein